MGEIWIPEAEDLKAAGTSGTMSGKGGPRATAHCTVSRPDQFDDMHRVLIGKKAEPHLLYSFVDDRLGQYFGLDRSARALMGSTDTPSGISHNKVGTVNIQIEFVGSTDDWTARPDWRPGPNFRAMMRAIASWDISPEFIFRPATTSLDRANVVRSFATMTGDAGGGKWWGHCHYPDGESHWDPGRLNVAKFFAAAGYTNTTTEEDDMYTDADRERDQYISAQIKATAQLVVDYSLKTNARVDALAATVGVLANAQGLDPGLVQKTIADAVTAALSNLKITAEEPK